MRKTIALGAALTLLQITILAYCFSRNRRGAVRTGTARKGLLLPLTAAFT